MRIRRAAADVAAALHTLGTGDDRLRDTRWLLWAGLLRLSLPVLKHAIPLSRLVRAVRITAGGGRPSALARRSVLLQQWMDRSSPLLSSNCLERSLIVYGTLCACNDVTLVVGFRRAGQNVLGHTWIERDGRVILEPPAPADAFSRTCAFDANGRFVSGGATLAYARARQAGVV